MNDTTPALYSASLAPATEAEIKASLRPLFAQWPVQSTDIEGKLLGYFHALTGEPKWAIDRAVSRFIDGKVGSHNAAYLPTSAEIGRETRAQSEFARKYRERAEPKIQLSEPELSPEELSRRAAKVAKVKRLFAGIVDHVDVTPKDEHAV